MKQLLYINEFGKAFIPERIRPKLRNYLLKAGIVEVPYWFFGILFYITYLLTFLVYFYGFWGTISEQTGILVFLYVFLIWVVIPLAFIALFMLFMYMYLDIKIFNRTKKMEDVLPDFLQEVSSNLKGGLAFEKSLWVAIKPRFGILANEIALAAKKVMTGTDVDIALNEFANKYNSPMLKRAMELIVSEIQSGGKVADIIDRVVENLKKTKALKDEMTASVLTYMIFIGAIVIFISPMLFALAYNLLIVISKVAALLATTAATGGTTGLLSNIGNINVNKEDFVWFSRIALGVIAFFSSMIVSIIEKGNIRGGVKYIPIFIVSTEVVYIIALKIMTAVVTAFITF
ncbi:type II secretion system F family protein [Candidatus Woesearchaeota archaeon]|nr:type II secretion system F family protein [Candidatus Woesearchaeota archaeon]